MKKTDSPFVEIGDPDIVVRPRKACGTHLGRETRIWSSPLSGRCAIVPVVSSDDVVSRMVEEARCPTDARKILGTPDAPSVFSTRLGAEAAADSFWMDETSGLVAASHGCGEAER